MRTSEFKKLTVKQLEEKADEQLAQAEAVDINTASWPEERNRHHFEAQTYLAAAARKSDASTSLRDLILEIVVIILIGGEIYEGWQQGKILDQMNKNTADTAIAMKAARDSLTTLAGDQEKSLDHLKEMNDKLQASLRATGTMASAIKTQLAILEAQQAEHRSEVAKKPKLALYCGIVPLDTTFKVKLTVREETDTSTSFDFTLINEGNLTATNPLMRAIILDKNAALQSSVRFERTIEPTDSATHTYLFPVNNIRPGQAFTMTMTFTFPKGEQPFGVYFNGDAEGIPTATPLGSMTVTPRKPVSP